jgi:hypothetical protein
VRKLPTNHTKNPKGKRDSEKEHIPFVSEEEQQEIEKLRCRFMSRQQRSKPDFEIRKGHQWVIIHFTGRTLYVTKPIKPETSLDGSF